MADVFTKPVRKLPVSRIRPGQPFAACFAPKGRTHYALYAVCVKDHQGVVKIGRTLNWKSRRVAYANWNLSGGDAITDERVFVVTEDYIDLPRLERAILSSCPFPIRSGSEWFVADFEEVCRYIDNFLCEAGLSYV